MIAEAARRLRFDESIRPVGLSRRALRMNPKTFARSAEATPPRTSSGYRTSRLRSPARVAKASIIEHT